MPRFSVIIPIYNVEKFLNQCVNSLLNQKYENAEIILVDDGSTDNCPEICDSFAQKDKRVKVIHKENGGLVSARQEGCKIASGDYILNVDGDDWVSQTYFQVLDKIICEFAPDIVCFGANCVYTEAKTVQMHPELADGFYDKKMIRQKLYPFLIQDFDGNSFMPSVWSKAIRRSIYTECQLKLDPMIKIGEDVACTKPAIVKSNSLYIIHNSIYCYRQNNLSMTKNRKPFMWQGPELVSKALLNGVSSEDYNFDDQIYRYTVHSLFNVAVSQYYKNDNFFSINKDVKTNLNNCFYKNAILNCHFSGKKGKLAYFTLRYRFYFVMLLYSRIRK